VKANSTKKSYDALYNEAQKILYIIEKREMEINLLKDKIKLSESGFTSFV